MRIQHNIMAMNAYRNYTNNVSAMKKNLERLSSGYKINRAGDDAAGLAISEKMRAQITGLETAQKNAKDGISLVQTAEGALTEVHDMLNRMVELATQSANGTYDNDTDRYQLQKEVNQLLSEIDRIADSSNFNGIKLLNGTLGLNTEAFSFSDAAAVKASDGTIDVSTLLAQAADGSPKVHLEEKSATQVNPEAVIDFGDLTITAAAAGDTVTADVSVFGKTYNISLTGKTSYTKADIASALQTAIQGTADAVKSADGTVDGTATNNDAIKIGNNVYKLAAHADGLKVTLAGTFTGTTYKAATATPTAASNDFTEAQATQMNKDLGFDVTVSNVAGSTGKTGDVIHKATQVAEAVAHKDASKAGIDIKLSDLVKDGNTLTIDGQTFFFKTNANTTATTGTTAIDVSAYAEDDWVHAAADLLSKQTVTGQDNRTWKIGVNGDGTTIHIDQTQASAATKELDTYDKLVGVISAKGQSTTDKNVGTNIKIDNAKVAEGNVLTIGEGDNAVKYVFTEDLEGKTDSATTKYVKFTKGGTDAATNLQTKIGGTSEINTAKDTVTVRAAQKGDPAPMVLGKGLTLQIGDTSDSFNQLNVAVQDMHAKSLGIENLKIDTEESAQQAIQKIKDAINTVSDVRGTLGATQNRLDHTINNLSVMTENIQDAESTIRDTDVAEEMMAYTKNNILIQSAQAMLAQANQVPQGVLQLLQ